MHALYRYTLSNLKQLSRWIPELELPFINDWPCVMVEESDFLQGESLITPLLGIMSGYVGAEAGQAFLEHYTVKDPITPLSAYWLAECCSRAGLQDKAWAAISTVWGNMLSHGATTFWESVTLNQGVNDFHDALTTYTAYRSYRISLCHSWASTPVNWICSHVLGIEPAEPGYASIRFLPRPMGNMTTCKGTVGTPFGQIKVEWSVSPEGELLSNIEAPEGIRIQR